MKLWDGILGCSASEGIQPRNIGCPGGDVFHLTEGSTLITDSPNLQSWNIAGSSGAWQGGASPAGSETVARYQMDIMGTRESQSVLPLGV